jgi:MoaA/NifB/PqqE/SkfB family radical SAM enzyme
MIVMERVRNKNQNYDAWLHWNVSSQCNFSCDYCFGKTSPNGTSIFSIDSIKLMNTLHDTGKIFRISFTGGEPFLIPNIIETSQQITKKHFISFNTNLVSPKIQEFSKVIFPERVLNIHASLHFNELIDKKLLSRFIENFHLLNSRDFNIYAEAIADPADLEKIDYYRSLMLKEGIKFTFAPFYGKHKNKFYPQSYTSEEMKLFSISSEHIEAFNQKGSKCIAGFNAAVVSPKGNISPCFQIQQPLGNIYESITFNENTLYCPSNNCACPLNYYDSYLFNKSKS